MRSYDLTPLYRATVGFDRIADLLARAGAADATTAAYPPYNIEKTGDDAYRISLAVAGFAEDDLNVEVKDAALVVTARRPDEAEGRSFLHRGIATRAFERRFALADHVRVTGAVHENGMLHIDLLRETPPALRARRIEIGKGSTQHETVQATLPEIAQA